MKWVLLLIYFAGPTSADRIKYAGSYATEELCEAEAKRQSAATWDYPEHVCFPVSP